MCFGLTVCVKCKHRHVANFLIECGANVNCVFDDRSALSNAVTTQNLDLVEVLVANGADINQRVAFCEEGTVLHEACEVRNERLLMCLNFFCKSFVEISSNIICRMVLLVLSNT